MVIHDGIGVVTDIRISGDAVPNGFTLGKLRHFRFLISARDMSNGFGQLPGKIGPHDGKAGGFLPGSIHGIVPGHPAEYHFRMIGKVAVDGNAVLSLSQVYPVRLNINGAVTLLEEDDIRSDFGSRVRFESVVGQTNSAQQFSTLGDVFPHFR